MRTDKPNVTSTAARTVAKVRAEYQRARRRFLDRPAPLRWSIAIGTLAAGVGLAYAAATNLPASSSAYIFLRSGARFSSDDLIAITRTLDAKHLAYRVDGQKRVEVAVDEISEANDSIAKLGVGPKRIEEIRKEAIASNPFDPMWVGAERRNQAGDEFLETMLRRLPGIVNAVVRVNRPVTRGGSRSVAGASAFVWIETENDHEISSTTVERIQTMIAGAEPEIKPAAVTVFDTSGNNYLNPHNPALGEQAHTRAREEKLKQEILDKLDRIKGVEVSVKLVPGPVIPPPTPLPPLPAAKPVEPEIEIPDLPLPTLSMGVNQPLDSADETTTPAPTPTSATAPPAESPVVEVPAPPAAQPVPVPPKAKVWVMVPRGYYLRAVRDKEPSLEDYQPLVERTEKLIITAVHHVVPPGQLEEPVAVSIVPEDVSEPRAVSNPADSRRSMSWWIPAGVAAAASAAITLLVFRAFTARRPLSRTLAGELGRGRIDRIDDSADAGVGPGPSERVRELIRLNPRAAASVLHRWTGHGQGEPIA